jgi:hypothetical protein
MAFPFNSVPENLSPRTVVCTDNIQAMAHLMDSHYLAVTSSFNFPGSIYTSLAYKPLQF